MKAMFSFLKRRATASVLGIASMLGIAMMALLATPTVSWAAKMTCLTGTDPSVASDLGKIVNARTSVEGTCTASAFDGSPGKTHAKYVSCAKSAIAAAASAGNLRKQCKATVTTYYKKSTAGQPPSLNLAPCIKSFVGGKVTCSIQPASTCAGTACPGVATCIDAADTNLDGIVGIGDSGSCACSTGFQDHPDGTITDCARGLMWEKKDASGGLHDELKSYSSWAGLCGCASGFCTGNEPMCQPNAAAASTCAADARGTAGCAECAVGTCNVNPQSEGDIATTAWDWIAQLNAAKFAGYSDWRIPSIGRDGGQPELETTLLPLCPSEPSRDDSCALPAFNTSCTPGCTVDTCSCSMGVSYWSSTTSATDPTGAWQAQVSGNGSLSRPPDIFRASKWGYVGAVRVVRNGSAPLPTAVPATPTGPPSATPTPTSPPAAPVCGNGICEPGEQCSACGVSCCCSDCACPPGFTSSCPVSSPICIGSPGAQSCN